MPDADYNRLALELEKLSPLHQTQSGLLGYFIDGTLKVVDPDDRRRFFVRFPNGNFVSAFHYNRVVQTPDRPVLIAYDHLGRPFIVGEDPTKIGQFSPQGAGAVGFHTHVRGSGMEFKIDTWLLKQLRVTISGVTATIEAGSYMFNRSLRWYAGGTYDLTSLVPTNAWEQRWVVIGINPITNTLVTATTDVIVSYAAPDKSEIASIDFVENGYIPLAAFWLQGEETSVPSYRIEDLRFAIGSLMWYLEDLYNVQINYEYVDGYSLVRRDQYWLDEPSSGGFSGDTGDIVYPKRATLWHDEALVTVGNAFTYIHDANQDYAKITQTATPADGDTFTHSFMLRAGTYTLSILGATGNNRGILDWYIDDVLKISGQDWYSASSVYNVVKTASVTVSGDGYHVLKGVINGKNVSSSTYRSVLTKYSFFPSSD